MTRAAGSVLTLLLDHHPVLLSVDEVVRALTAGSQSFAERDRVDDALRELVESGLAQRLGSFVFASRAATCFQRVDEV